MYLTSVFLCPYSCLEVYINVLTSVQVKTVWVWKPSSFSSHLPTWTLLMLRGKPPVPDTLSQSQIGGEASSSRLNYTGETRNSSSAEAAWTRRKNTPMQVTTEQSSRLALARSRNGVKYCRNAMGYSDRYSRKILFALAFQSLKTEEMYRIGKLINRWKMLSMFLSRLRADEHG